MFRPYIVAIFRALQVRPMGTSCMANCHRQLAENMHIYNNHHHVN